jgi:hypothetical protein
MKPSRHILILIALLASNIPLKGQDPDKLQSWTASDGRVTQAKFIKLDGDSVVIEKEGRQFAVPFSKLNAESVALAKELAGKTPPPAKSDAIDISPSRFVGKSFVEIEKEIGKPTAIDEKRFAREYSPLIPGISRIKLQRFSRATECMDVYYYFPKGTIRNFAEAFAAINLSTEGLNFGLRTSLPANENASNLYKAALAPERARMGSLSVTSGFDDILIRTAGNINMVSRRNRWHRN